MKTIASAKRKYADKVPSMKANYLAGMSAFLGKDVSGSAPAQNYGNSIGAASADKWERNFKAAFGA